MASRRELPELVVTIERQDLIRYAGAANDYLPQHWDQATMREQGFADVVVHGWLGLAHLVRTATQVLVPGRWVLTNTAVRYLQAIYPGDITCGGTVHALEGGRREVSGWIKIPDGRIATTAELIFRDRLADADV